MDDQAIIVRHNGDAYLIEKSVGCLSLWERPQDLLAKDKALLNRVERIENRLSQG